MDGRYSNAIFYLNCCVVESFFFKISDFWEITIKKSLLHLECVCSFQLNLEAILETSFYTTVLTSESNTVFVSLSISLSEKSLKHV